MPLGRDWRAHSLTHSERFHFPPRPVLGGLEGAVRVSEWTRQSRPEATPLLRPSPPTVNTVDPRFLYTWLVMIPILCAKFGRVYFQDGKHPGSKIFYVGDGFYYHVHAARDNSPLVQLRCSRKGRTVGGIRCRGRAVITRDGVHYWMTQGHTHTPDFLYPLELELRRRIYLRLSYGDATPFRNIIREEGQRLVHYCNFSCSNNRLHKLIALQLFFCHAHVFVYCVSSVTLGRTGWPYSVSL